MLISAAVPFCLLLKGVELLILRPTRHTSALLFHRVVSVSDGKITECFYDTRVLGLDPAPLSFRHARPRVRRPSGLDPSVLGPVSNSVVSDLFRKSARQEKRRNVPPGSM